MRNKSDMESSSKRRKIDHSRQGIRQNDLIDFTSRDAARVSTASMFVLQTDELMKEAVLDYPEALKDVDATLHKLKDIIESIEPHPPIPIHEATTKLEKKYRMTIPFPDPKPEKDAPYKLSYEKPAQCNVVGSYVSRTMVKSQQRYAVDMVVQMPQSMFQEKDYLNMRYFYRRAYYLAYLAAHIKKQLGPEMRLEFEDLNENPLLPVLLISPQPSTAKADNGKGSDSGKQIIRLIPCAPDGIAPRAKIGPSVNCNKANASDEQKKSTGTPFYNSTIKAESSFIHYLRLLAKAQKECAALSEACILGRIWLHQRGFGGNISEGGFGHFEWATMIALLLKSGGKRGQAALSTSLSGSELFKAVLQFLSTADFTKAPVVLGASELDTTSIRESGPVLYDSARNLNILYKMTPWSMSRLQYFAKSMTDLMADETADTFESAFIIKADIPVLNFDAHFEVQIERPPKLAISSDCRSLASNLSAEVFRVLKKAYGNRAQMISIQQPPSASWGLNSSQPSQKGRITVGVMFEAAHMARQLDRGPSAEQQKEAAVFRHFWGKRAELRRFKDGSIFECIEWKNKLPFTICEEITTYILNLQLGIESIGINTLGDGFTSLIEFSHLDKEAFDAIRKAFQTFEYDIRNLEELPLQIRQLALVSPIGRYTSIQPPLPGFHTGMVDPLDVNIYFEASSKWPENLTAIQKAKIEFLLDIDRRLTTANKNISTHLGRENKSVETENQAYLDIIYDKGAAFRLRVHCDLEEAILDRQCKNKTLDTYLRDESEETLAKFRYFFTLLPLHTQTIATHCTRLHALSSTIRLTKHWFNCHKLAGHFSEELIELFVLHVFLQPYPWKTPTSVSTGFLRTLFFLSRWNWRDEPLIIDTAESITPDDRVSIRKDLESWRKRDPGMNRTVLFVATSNDNTGQAFTCHSPSKLIASRMTRLAKAACNVVKQEPYAVASAQLFEPSLQDYDVLIHVCPKAIKSILREVTSNGTLRTSSSVFKNLNGSISVSAPLPIRTHPVNILLEELQRTYEDSLIFFHGGTDERTIGAIWNPKLQQQKFRAGLPYNFSRVGEPDEDTVEVNKKAVLLEIARIGGDLIRKIEEDDE